MSINGASPFRAADAVTKGLTGCCVAVRLVLVTVVVVVIVLVTVLPVADIAAGLGAELPVALIKNTKKKSSNERFRKKKKSDVCLMFAILI